MFFNSGADSPAASFRGGCSYAGIAARCQCRGTARGHPRALPRAPSCSRPFPARVKLCKCWLCGSSTASCIFEQALLFPVSCQIIAFGIQGSSALRRTKLKLELVELRWRNTVFPGDARAACGQTPTAAESRVLVCSWCDPGMPPCAGLPGAQTACVDSSPGVHPCGVEQQGPTGGLVAV